MSSNVVDAYVEYRNRCNQEGLHSDDPNAITMMARERIKMDICEEFGLDYFLFELDRMETYAEAMALKQKLLGEHTDEETLTYEEFIRQYYRRPNHKRDLPILALPLIQEYCMPAADAAELLKFVWVTVEFPADSDDLVEEWREAFDRLGYVTDSDDGPPMEAITVYRGADRDSDGWGLSWTTDLERAKWFAYRLGKKNRAVFTALAPPESVLAHFTGRNEDEYVIDPYMINPVEWKEEA